MIARGQEAMKIGIARNWWILAARGLLAIAFGLYVVLMPGTALATIILAFGVAVLVAGILAITAAMRVHDQHERSFVIAVEGVICVLFGLLALLRPGASALVWLFLVSGFAVVSGILHMATAIQLRRQIEGEWVLILNGALTTLLGVLMLLLPWAGLLSLIWLIGIYSLCFGVLLVALAIRLRGRLESRLAAYAH